MDLYLVVDCASITCHCRSLGQVDRLVPPGLERTLASSAGVALAGAEVNARNLGGPIRLRGAAANYNLAAIATLVEELGVPDPVEIVPKPKGVKNVTVLSRRWVVDPKSPY